MPCKEPKLPGKYRSPNLKESNIQEDEGVPGSVIFQRGNQLSRHLAPVQLRVAVVHDVIAVVEGAAIVRAPHTVVGQGVVAPGGCGVYEYMLRPANEKPEEEKKNGDFLSLLSLRQPGVCQKFGRASKAPQQRCTWEAGQYKSAGCARSNNNTEATGCLPVAEHEGKG